MKNSMLAVLVLSSTALLSGCAGHPANNEVSYNPYKPGYTGYTVGYGPYGIPNGYSPYYWNPGFYNNTDYSTGYNRGYGREIYYGTYRGVSRR